MVRFYCVWHRTFSIQIICFGNDRLHTFIHVSHECIVVEKVNSNSNSIVIVYVVEIIFQQLIRFPVIGGRF